MNLLKSLEALRLSCAPPFVSGTTYPTPTARWLRRRPLERSGTGSKQVFGCVLYLTLAASLLTALLTGPGSLPLRIFSRTDGGDGPPVLDSFSEPATACAILKQETQRLWDTSETGPGNEGRPSPGQACDCVSETRTEALKALEAQVQDVALDVNRRLMQIELNHHSWNEVVDRFVSLLYQAPQGNDVRLWVRCALDSAQKCGRIEELEGALRCVIRGHHPHWSSAALEAILDDWEAQQLSGMQAAKP